MYTARINVGKLFVRTPKNPSESGYVEQMRDTMKQLEGIFTDLLNQYEGIMPDTLIQALRPTQLKAIEYTPTKTGALRASTYLEVTERGQNTRVELGFAKGGQPPYGVYVHENMAAYHKPPTRSKFLQAAVFEDMENIRQRIVSQLTFR